MTVVAFLVGLLAGVLGGAFGYRWMAKNDPALLEKWMKEAQEKIDEIKS
jgi:type IV secretory pathway TrbD component